MKYTELVQTRLTPEQMRTLEVLANDEGLSVATWIRRAVLREIKIIEASESQAKESEDTRNDRSITLQ